MTIHWKAVEQYFTVMLFVNPLTPRVKPWVIQSSLTFDSMDRILKCDHSLEAVEQYFTVILFVNPLTHRVKPWVIQNFLTFDSMDRILKCDHSLESVTVEQYCLFFNCTQFVILENLSTLDLALSGVKGLMTLNKNSRNGQIETHNK